MNKQFLPKTMINNYETSQDWLKDILQEVEYGTQQGDEEYLNELKKQGHNWELLKKVIFQDYANPGKKTIRTAIEEFFNYRKNFSNPFEYDMKIIDVLRDLKQQDPDKYHNWELQRFPL